jgi:hypothetical protein
MVQKDVDHPGDRHGFKYVLSFDYMWGAKYAMEDIL